MKKLTLFNIELKCDIDQYNGHVAAENASEAEEKAREGIFVDHIVWWANEGRSIEVAAAMDSNGKTHSEDDLDKIFHGQVEELKNMRLTMLEELGKVLI